MSTVKEIQQRFMSSPQFAVVGASKDQSKFGTKVLKWYKEHGKAVTPIHPKEANLEGIDTVPKLSDLSSPSTTSVSIITPPVITLNLLKEAKELNVPALWLQPGAENDEVRSYIAEEGLTNKVLLGGPCILVDGEGIIRSLL
ncbi:NAD(P)-binding protein [Ramaria rubella]|nr:NAD(P)-binding protein [Ramaria rubella]